MVLVLIVSVLVVLRGIVTLQQPGRCFVPLLWLFLNEM